MMDFIEKEEELEKFYAKSWHLEHSESPRTFSGHFRNVSDELAVKLIMK